jgi:hypothetical protein
MDQSYPKSDIYGPVEINPIKQIAGPKNAFKHANNEIMTALSP